MPTVPDVPLMPLRIPIGWAVLWNDFREVFWGDGEDLLLLGRVDPTTCAPLHLLIDLGWYGSEAEGTLRLEVVRGNFEETLLSFESRDRERVRSALERWLQALSVPPGGWPAALKRLAEQHPRPG